MMYKLVPQAKAPAHTLVGPLQNERALTYMAPAKRVRQLHADGHCIRELVQYVACLQKRVVDYIHGLAMTFPNIIYSGFQ